MLREDEMDIDEDMECLDDHRGHCKGAVEYRMSLTGTGVAIARCDHHWDLRLRKEDELREVYPDSPLAPAWFDPMAAGEHWDEDY